MSRAAIFGFRDRCPWSARPAAPRVVTMLRNGRTLAGFTFLLAAGGGFALMSNGLAAADTTRGEISVQCRYSVFEDPEQSGQEARGALVNFDQRVPITVDDNGQII